MNAMHITASVFINDDEAGSSCSPPGWSGSPYDPSPKAYSHNRTGEDNGMLT